MQAISLIQLFDLPQRELFERKDQVQSDGTNDPYKHFALYQYLKLISSALELRYCESLPGDAAEKENLTQDFLRGVRTALRTIDKVHGCTMFPKVLTEGYMEIFKHLPREVLSLRVPLFMDIALLSSTDDPSR